MGCLFGYCGKPARGLLDKMAGVLRHRCADGFEKTSINTGPDHVVKIGHGIPSWDADSHVAKIPDFNIVFGYAGVIFNAEDISSEKEFLPHVNRPRTGSDLAAKLLAGIATSPEEKIRQIEGAFVAVLAQGTKLTLVRDPAGIKVLYWARNKERLLFSSEVKALFADPAVPRKLRTEALPEYLTFSFIPGDRTMFEDVQELQPGTTLTSQEDRVLIHRHFLFEQLEWKDGEIGNENEYAVRLRSELEISVRECCRFDGTPPAVFLSGGIDSSAVLALLAQEFPHETIKTFSVHFGPDYANENEFVAMMAGKYQTDHTWLEICPKSFLKRMRRIIWHLDDPIGDPITVPNFLMSEAASKVSRVVLNGEGGDPCFGGPKNIPMLLALFYGPRPGEASHGWLERNYLLSYRKCFTDLAQMLDPAILKASGGEEALISIITPYLHSEVPRNFLNRLMATNIRLKGANLILVKVEKMTSANGLLALAPLFSKRVIEASLACPPTLKLDGNIEKGILKKAVKDIVPAPIVKRPKSGMMVPVRFWLRGEMRRFAKKILSKRNLTRLGYFNPQYVKKLIDYDKTEIQGTRYGLKLWMLITFMLWHEQMVEKKEI
ncbi:asparagine synthetase B family protein [Thermodesulfobacteriota bacterium]